MNTSSDSFGRRLKMERESREIPLETIAASTKIKRSLLADLERDDLSKWPQGIFGRGFVREYAASIGLAPEPVVAEFVRLFAEQQPGELQTSTSTEFEHQLRLTLADGGRNPLASIALRVTTAALEMGAIAAAAQALAWSTGLNFWTVCGTASLTYYGLASACWEGSPASRWLRSDRRRRDASDEPARSRSRDLLGLLVQQAQIHRLDTQQSAMSAHAAAAENLRSAV
jgi:transcriptional regulator with XRE-family HTH domain